MTTSDTALENAPVTVPVDEMSIGELETIIDLQYPEGVTKEAASIPLRLIKTNTEAFQPRDEWNEWEQEAHIRTLAKAIKKDGKLEPIEPITVIPVQGAFVVLDGHMRLLAYEEAGWDEDALVPVVLFRGPSSEALKFAIEANSRDKLSLTTGQKLQAAWRMVCHAEVYRQHHGKLRFTQREIAATASVSTGSVANAAKTLREALEKMPLGEAVEMTYEDAKRCLRGKSDEGDWDSDAIRDARVQDFTNRIGRTFGKRLHPDADIFAEALEAYSGRAAARIMEAMIERDPVAARSILEMVELDAIEEF